MDSNATSAVSQDSSSGDRVLIVDDEAPVRELIRRALSKHGFECRVAADSAEAIAAVAEEDFSLVISDIHMPGADGTWLLGEIKQRRPEVPVLMLTGDSDVQMAVKCLKAGAADYLTKPINLDELLCAARRSVDYLRLARENREYRSSIESMEQRSLELQNAFHLIEATYREAVGALTNVEQSPPRPRPDFIRPSAESPKKGSSPDLAALYTGARLIADGASPVELASAIGAELVNGGVARSMGFWRQGTAERGIELVAEQGTPSAEYESVALKTVSSGTTHREPTDGVDWVSAPVSVAGEVEGAFVIGWMAAESFDVVAATERLALYLATSLKLEYDARERDRATQELDLFQKLASASRYSLDLQHVAHFIMDSLHRIVDYDVAGLLLLDEHRSLHIQTRFPAESAFVEQVQTHILNTLRLTCGVDVEGDLDVRVERVPAKTPPRKAPGKLRSFVNVPLSVGNHVAGLIHISSGRERAFSQQETLFLHRAANFLASSVQGVRELLATVKGRIEQMVEHMTDGVLMLDHGGNVTAMNHAARSLLRIDGESDYRPKTQELVGALDFDPLDLIRSEGRSLRKVVCVHGVPYQLQLSPVYDGDELAGAVVAFRNFSEEQRIDEMKTEFINVVSHELRTPLTAIRNAIALVRGPRLGELSKGQSHFIELAQRNVDQLISIINDLLDLSKIEAGKMHIELSPTEPREIIETTVASLTPRADEEGVALDLRLPQTLPTLYACASSLQRALTNLLGNAIKFTERGGRVSVDVALSARDSGAGSLEIAVSDTGVGIPKDQLESIFEKFHQVDQSRSQSVAGTGLGLPITRELVRAHHGDIVVESEPGKGSRFTVVIPVLTENELFYRALGRELERARQQQTPLSVSIIRLDRRDERHQDAGDDETFDDLVDVVKNVFHRSGDQVLVRRKRKELVAVLPRTDAEGARGFEARLQETIRETVSSDGRFSVSCASSSYPEDAETPEELYRAADERRASPDKGAAFSTATV